MENEITSIESAAGIYESTKSRVDSGIRAEVESDVRKTVINRDGHGRKHRARERGVHGERFDELHQEMSALNRTGRKGQDRGWDRRRERSLNGRRNGHCIGKGLSSNIRWGRRQ
jgi:hypothetical protein